MTVIDVEQVVETERRRIRNANLDDRAVVMEAFTEAEDEWLSRVGQLVREIAEARDNDADHDAADQFRELGRTLYNTVASYCTPPYEEVRAVYGRNNHN